MYMYRGVGISRSASERVGITAGAEPDLFFRARAPGDRPPLFNLHLNPTVNLTSRHRRPETRACGYPFTN